MSLGKGVAGKAFDLIPDFGSQFIRMAFFFAVTEKTILHSVKFNPWSGISAQFPDAGHQLHRGSIHRNDAPLWLHLLDRPWSRRSPAWSPPSRDEPFLAFLDRCGGVCIRACIPDRATSGRMIELAATSSRYSSLSAWPVACAWRAILHRNAPIVCPSREVCFDLWVFFELLYLSDIELSLLDSHRWSEWQTWCVQVHADSGYQTCASQYPLQHAYRYVQVESPLEAFLLQYNNESACVKSRFHRHELSDARACRGGLDCISESTYRIDQG